MSKEDSRYCVDCRWHKEDASYKYSALMRHTCSHSHCTDRVTGEPVATSCYAERRCGAECGTAGNWFELNEKESE